MRSINETDAIDNAEPTSDVDVPCRDRRWLRRRVVIVAIVLSVGAMIQWHREIGLAVVGRWFAAKSGAPSINVAEAMEMIEAQDALVLDVRDSRESATSHLRGAEQFTLEDLEAGRLPEGARRGRPIITYCTIGYRSGVAATLLAEKGHEAHNLRGGILALAQASAPLVDREGPTWKVHTWSKGFAWLLAADHEAIWDQDAP